MCDLTKEQIQFAIDDLEFLKTDHPGYDESVDIAIIALETCREYAPVINLMNQHLEEAERRIIYGDPNAPEPIGLLTDMQREAPHE